MTEPDLAAPPTPGVPGQGPHRAATRWMQRLAEETAQQAQTVDDETPAGPAHLGAAILFLLSLLWLAATMWSAHASILDGSYNVGVALSAVAGSLPAVIAASLLAGAGAGLLAAGRYAPDPTPTLQRLLIGLAAGTTLGVASAALIIVGYGTTSSIAVLAITVGTGASLGGAAAATPRPVFAAGIAASLSMLALGALFTWQSDRLTNVLGAADTYESQAATARTFAYMQAGACGIVAGLVAFWYLRRHGSRAWPWYLLAGAVPGGLLLLTELLTHLGGASLFDLVRGLSEGDKLAVDYLDFARLRNALVVIFVSALTSMIAVGRTLRSAE